MYFFFFRLGKNCQLLRSYRQHNDPKYRLVLCTEKCGFAVSLLAVDRRPVPAAHSHRLRNQCLLSPLQFRGLGAMLASDDWDERHTPDWLISVAVAHCVLS